MSVKLEKLGEELAKARKKKELWDARVEELEEKYREEENTEIHEMVHAANLTPDQLAELLRMFANKPSPDPDTMDAISEEGSAHEG